MTKTILIVFAVGSAYLIGNQIVVTPVSVADATANSTAPNVTWQQDESEDIKEQARKEFMQGKLQSNKKIVQGLTTNDFDLVKQGAEEVSSYVKGESWFVLKTPEYQAFSEDMRQTAGKLNQAAEERNVEAAALRYFELTINCIDCHQYIAKVQY